MADQCHPDGTRGHNYRRHAQAARRAREKATEHDAVTWAHLLREPYYEALAETDPARLQAALARVTAVCTAWNADLEHRTATTGA